MNRADKNKLFYSLLHAVKDDSGKRPRWTLEKIAAEIYVNRSHLTDVINNKENHGKHTRPKLVRFFKMYFAGDSVNGKKQWEVLLQALGWDEEGRIVPHGTSDMQQSEATHG